MSSDRSWSPDSSKPSFDRQEPGIDGQELWMVNVDGTGLHQVTHTPALPPGEYSGWAWLPPTG